MYLLILSPKETVEFNRTMPIKTQLELEILVNIRTYRSNLDYRVTEQVQVTPKVMIPIFFSMDSAKDTKRTITLSDRAIFQLQNTIFLPPLALYFCHHAITMVPILCTFSNTISSVLFRYTQYLKPERVFIHTN